MGQVSKIESRIFTIRGLQVMLDRDLAELYQVPVKVLNQAVKRNIDRFPPDFNFQLTEDEFKNLNLRSQIVTSSSHGGIRYMPYAF
ncbi:MAG: ORF6N domain-containing protein, partial [Fibromonadales bacterium]|nr:ORF6N domain-containing protein [Fibromonadales bacterium]